MNRGLGAAALAAMLAVSVSASAVDAPAASIMTGPETSLPVPRFVSLKAAGANGRRGPGLNHRVDWIYQRPGLPLQVTGESGPWRRVRDPDGAETWMHAQNLDPRRTVIVVGREDLAIRQTTEPDSRITAYLSPGVTADLTDCDADLRRVTINGRVGWAPATAFWGAASCDKG
jgi:SH3-like domain-containing protein